MVIMFAWHDTLQMDIYLKRNSDLSLFYHQLERYKIIQWTNILHTHRYKTHTQSTARLFQLGINKFNSSYLGENWDLEMLDDSKQQTVLSVRTEFKLSSDFPTCVLSIHLCPQGLWYTVNHLHFFPVFSHAEDKFHKDGCLPLHSWPSEAANDASFPLRIAKFIKS